MGTAVDSKGRSPSRLGASQREGCSDPEELAARTGRSAVAKDRHNDAEPREDHVPVDAWFVFCFFCLMTFTKAPFGGVFFIFSRVLKQIQGCHAM